MKKKSLSMITIILVAVLALGAGLFGYYKFIYKSNDDLPSEEVLAQMDEAELNDLLLGYKIQQVTDVWGMPDQTSDNEATWELTETVNLVVSYNNHGKIVACGLSDRTGAETSNSSVPSIVHEGQLYCTTEKQMSVEVDESAYVGKITSTVPPSQCPVEEGQANFGGIGDPIAMISDGLVVLMDHEWTLFEFE